MQSMFIVTEADIMLTNINEMLAMHSCQTEDFFESRQPYLPHPIVWASIFTQGSPRIALPHIFVFLGLPIHLFPRIGV
jgi:hypothetical protein